MDPFNLVKVDVVEDDKTYDVLFSFTAPAIPVVGQTISSTVEGQEERYYVTGVEWVLLSGKFAGVIVNVKEVR